MVIIVSLHLLLAVGFMLYFFHVPGNPAIHNTNVTVAPASNGTDLKSAASVVIKPEGDHLEEEADKSESIAPDTGGGGGTENDQTSSGQVKTEKTSGQAGAREPEDQKGDPPRKEEDSAEKE